jgi:hypothetical protein
MIQGETVRDKEPVAEVICGKVRTLPEPEQMEVLSFVDYLFYKSRQEEQSWMDMSLRAALRGLEDEVWPDYDVQDLQERWT